MIYFFRAVKTNIKNDVYNIYTYNSLMRKIINGAEKLIALMHR